MNSNDANDSLIESRIVQRLRDAGCVYAEEEAQLLMSAAQTPERLANLVKRREAGFPLEHLIGWVDFCELRIQVDPGVFIPRFRTEFLARQAVARAKPGDIVVDMCCGTGALGAVMLAKLDRIELHAVDMDPAAVLSARRNIQPDAGDVYEGDLFAPLPDRLRNNIDILVANAPYVPTESIPYLPQEARNHEERLALDGGTDGLDVIRRIVAAAPQWLAEEGCLLVETSKRQLPITVELFASYGLHPSVMESEDHDAIVVMGTPHR